MTATPPAYPQPEVLALLSLPLPLSNERLMTRAEVCARLGLTDREFRNACKSAGITGRRGFTFRFDRKCYDTLAEHLQKKASKKEQSAGGKAGVYFIETGQFIKIGYAKNAGKRLSELQVASPYEMRILGVIPGPKSLERELHQKFKKLHHRAEWFHAWTPLTSYIRRHAEKWVR